MALLSRGMNQILTKHMGGNKSGALLLTIFVLMSRRGDERFTIRACDWAPFNLAKLSAFSFGQTNSWQHGRTVGQCARVKGMLALAKALPFARQSSAVHRTKGSPRWRSIAEAGVGENEKQILAVLIFPFKTYSALTLCPYASSNDNRNTVCAALKGHQAQNGCR